MCGRFVAATPPAELAQYFDVTLSEQVLAAEHRPTYNGAPTDDIYGIVHTARGRELQVFRWGLVPLWAKDLKGGAKMINARAETLAVKNAFKPAFQRRRLLVPIDGFYEWKRQPGTKNKQPMFVHRVDGEPLAVAGLWETWRDPTDPEGRRLHSATIITVPANRTMEAVHDRMPAVMAPGAWDVWLDPSNEDLGALAGLLASAQDELLTMHAVSPAVNSVRTNHPELTAPLEVAGPNDDWQLFADSGRPQSL
ncbi:MAG: hypothetical protein JWL70_13 [Acidimicrobiia bacterium]|nr:hypothetical protein [Acidimicrobiia bacterium]